MANGRSVQALYASAARTSTPTAVTVSTGRFRGCILFIDATASAATPSVVAKIEGVHSSGAVFGTSLLTSAAITGTGVTMMTVYPGVTAATNVSASAALPDRIKVTLTHGDADSITYAVDLVMLP